MKKLFLLTVLMLVVSLFGCSKKPTTQEHPVPESDTTSTQSEKSYSDSAGPKDSFESIKNKAHDIFVATIVDVEELGTDVVFPNYGQQNGYYNLCTVKVEKLYLSKYVTEETTIKVINGWMEKDKDGVYILPFEKGKKYIMTGKLQPYDNKPVLAVFGNLSAEIKSDGGLVPVCLYSEIIYNGIDTIHQLENNVEFKDVCNVDPEPIIPKIFYGSSDENVDTEALVEDIKYALVNDCELKTRKVEYDNYPNK